MWITTYLNKKRERSGVETKNHPYNEKMKGEKS